MRSLITTASALAILRAADDEGGAGGGTTETAAAATANPPIVPLLDETKVANIKKLMKSRQVFDATEIEAESGEKVVTSGFDRATQHLSKVLAATENAYGLPVAIRGMDSEGNVDRSIYDEPGMRTVLAYVGHKADKLTGIKGIVVFPMPSLSAFVSRETGEEESADDNGWLGKIVEKECALVAFRNFRDAATVVDFQSGVNKAPATVDEYVTEYTRGGTGLDTDTFDALWTDIRNAIKKGAPDLSKALPGKPEILKSIRSAAYAKSEYPDIEEAGVFVKLAKLVISNAKSNTTLNEAKQEVPAPLETETIESWLAGRDTLVIEKTGRQELTPDMLAGFDFA